MNTSKTFSPNWFLIGVFTLAVGFLIAIYFLYDWISDQTPWSRRVLFSCMCVWFGWRVGVAISGERAKRPGANWHGIGVACLGLVVAIVFFLWRPYVKDRERDEAFVETRDGLKASVKSLNDLTASASGPNEPETAAEYSARLAACGESATQNMSNALQNLDKFTAEQRAELVQSVKDLREAIQAAKANRPKPQKDEKDKK